MSTTTEADADCAKGECYKATVSEARHRLKVVHWCEGRGRAIRATCRHWAISSSTLYSWLRRYERLGPVGLEDRSRRPRRVRSPTWSRELALAVFRLREEHSKWGKDKLAPLLREEG